MIKIKELEVNGKSENKKILFYNNLSYNCIYEKNVYVIEKLNEFKDYVANSGYRHGGQYILIVDKIIKEFENCNEKLRKIACGDIQVFTNELLKTVDEIDFSGFGYLLYDVLYAQLSNDSKLKSVYEMFKIICQEIGIYSFSESQFRKVKNNLPSYFKNCDGSDLDDLSYSEDMEIINLPLYVAYPPRISSYYQKKSGKFPYTSDDIVALVSDEIEVKQIKTGVIRQKKIIKEKNLKIINQFLKNHNTIVQNAFYAYYYGQLTKNDIDYLIENGHLNLDGFVKFGKSVGFNDIIEEFLLLGK